MFLRHPGQVLSREQLLSHVWGYDFDPGSNVVDVYVRYLRRKLGDDDHRDRPRHGLPAADVMRTLSSSANGTLIRHRHRVVHARRVSGKHRGET